MYMILTLILVNLRFPFNKFTINLRQNMNLLQGYSTSEVWYAVLDNGTNYCNLHNLITGKFAQDYLQNNVQLSSVIIVLQ